jgi:hypothetical protein
MTESTNEVLHYTQVLCEVLRENYKQYSIDSHRHYITKGENVEYHQEQIDKLCEGEDLPEYIIDKGRKYYKIVMKDHGQKHAHLFVDMNTGDCYKPSSWKAPAKGIRYNLLDVTSREEMYRRADWSGAYTYK